MDINELSKEWKYSRIKEIRSILSSKKINKTGRLSKSLKMKINQGKNPSIDFYWMFYGKYVRAHYLNKGFDILSPIKNVSELIKKISVDIKKQIIDDVKKTIKNGNSNK
jgi:hypothetical protein